MTIRRSIPALFAALLILIGWVPCRAEKILEHKYGNLPAHTLSVCSPTHPVKNMPAVLLIHGGGWTRGDKSSLRPMCKRFAENGIVAVTANYRLAEVSDHSTRWPAQLEDAQAALGWMLNHADELGLDPGRICSYGESAGGHIALWLGSTDERLACVVDAFGPTDLGTLGKAFEKALSALCGNTDENALRAASPLWSSVSGMPPTLVIQGEYDKLVPPDQSTRLVDRMKSEGATVVLRKYPGGHSWSDLTHPALGSIMEQSIAFIKTAPRRGR